MKKAFVIGWPISHSKSPVLHEFWLRLHNIEGSYQAIAVEPEKLEQFIKDLPSGSFVGGNVTIPHKEAILPMADSVDDAASRIGAVNTIWIENDSLHASNTDAYGFSANLDDHAPDWRLGRIATVLGAGGASRAVIFAALEAGYEKVRIVNRTPSRAEDLVQRFGPRCSAHDWTSLAEVLSDTDLLVNTTSLGMSGNPDTFPYSLDGLSSKSIVTDLVYNPLETSFLKAASSVGAKTVDGLGMLLYQAVPGFEIWFGLRPEVTPALRDHVLGIEQRENHSQ